MFDNLEVTGQVGYIITETNCRRRGKSDVF